jgi:hypothetical protein
VRIAVIDGQGGGIGKSIVEKLRKELSEEIEIIALGTNSLATSCMLKAGANEGATGENAIMFNVSRVEIIMGVIGVIVANSMLGELTPLMAKAIGESSAKKIFLPLNRCNIEIAGVDKNEPMPHLVEKAVRSVKEYIGGCKNV